jgi:hypothetical protein
MRSADAVIRYGSNQPLCGSPYSLEALITVMAQEMADNTPASMAGRLQLPEGARKRVEPGNHVSKPATQDDCAGLLDLPYNQRIAHPRRRRRQARATCGEEPLDLIQVLDAHGQAMEWPVDGRAGLQPGAAVGFVDEGLDVRVGCLEPGERRTYLSVDGYLFPRIERAGLRPDGREPEP